MSQQSRSTFVLVHPSEILAALVGLKDVRVVHYERRGPDVELMIEQVTEDVRCPGCQGPAQVKERPVVHHVDLPVYVIYARATVEPSPRIWDLMTKHAKVYVSPDAQVPVPEGSEPGFIVRYSITRIGGIGPWATSPAP